MEGRELAWDFKAIMVQFSSFSDYGEVASNNMMYLMTEYALREAQNEEFESPLELFDGLYVDTFAYGKKITENPRIRKTYALNGHQNYVNWQQMKSYHPCCGAA